jgi:hypothetical protein
MPVASGQTILKGDFLIIDANGRVTLPGTGASIPAATATTNHIVIADQNANSLAQDTLIQVVTADDTTTLSLLLSTTDSAQAFSAAFKGKEYDIRRGTASPYNWTVDVNGSTSPKVEVIDVDPNYPSTDTWGVVLCRPVVGQWAK